MWLPRGPHDAGAALDFAVSSGMQAGELREAASTPELVFERYEAKKCKHLDTARLCAAAGFRFCPMVIEAHGGGWSPSARRVLDWIAGQGAAASGEVRAGVCLRVAQRMSCVLQRENARAVLKRTVGAPSRAELSGWVHSADAWQ